MPLKVYLIMYDDMFNAYLHEPISHDVLVKLTVFLDNHIEDSDEVRLNELILCIY